MPKAAGAKAAPSNPTAAPRDPFEDFERDQWKRPRIPEPGKVGRSSLPSDKRKGGYTRASSLGGTLEDQTNIGRWRQAQAAWGVAHSRSLTLQTQAVPSPQTASGKTAMYDIVEKAMAVAESDGAAGVGTAIHAMTELVDQGLPLPKALDGEAREQVSAWVELTQGFRPLAIEAKTVCDDHQVAGTFDRLFATLGPMITPDGERLPTGTILLGDLKTSGTSDYFGLKFCVQLAEYAHGTPFDVVSYGRKPWEWLGEGAAQPNQKWGLIVHVPTGNVEASGLHWVDIESGRALSELAVTVREQRKRRDLVVPASPPTIPTALSAAGLKAAILGTNTREQIDALWRSHKGVWSEIHTEEAKRQIERFARLAKVGV